MEGPTQAEVEAKAAEMFGEGWKKELQHKKAIYDAAITRHLDAARAAVMKERL